MTITAISSQELNDCTSLIYAEEGDICYRINDTFCTCNLVNDCYNIGIESCKPKVSTVRDMLRFIKLLHEEYDIDYISIREQRKWPILNRVKHYTSNSNVHYIKISDNLNIFEREIPNELCK